MKSQIATPKQRVKEIEKDVQTEMWRFIDLLLKSDLKRFLESLLEDEVTDKVKAKKYERNHLRQGYRGGHYLRSLVTRYGLMENLRVPSWQRGV